MATTTLPESHSPSLPTEAPQARTLRKDRTFLGATALVLGLGLIFLVGFAPVSAVHNAAHDTRHSAAFPCH
jgi:cobalt transporter subunit CbtB